MVSIEDKEELEEEEKEEEEEEEEEETPAQKIQDFHSALTLLKRTTHMDLAKTLNSTNDEGGISAAKLKELYKRAYPDETNIIS